MTLKKLMDVTNEFSTCLEVYLEPVPELCVLEAGEKICVVATGDVDCVALRLGATQSGAPYVAIWKNTLAKGVIYLQKDGELVASSLE